MTDFKRWPQLVEWEAKGPVQNGKYVCPYCSKHEKYPQQEYMPCKVCAKNYGIKEGSRD